MFLLSARLWIIFHVVWRSTNHRYVAALDNWKSWSQLWKSSTKQKPIDFSFLSDWAPAFHVDYLIYATEQWRGGFHLEKKITIIKTVKAEVNCQRQWSLHFSWSFVCIVTFLLYRRLGMVVNLLCKPSQLLWVCFTVIFADNSKLKRVGSRAGGGG